MIVKAQITKGMPSLIRRSHKWFAGPFRVMLGHTNSPERKKNIAMKKLSVASTIMSKPKNDFGSV